MLGTSATATSHMAYTYSLPLCNKETIDDEILNSNTVLLIESVSHADADPITAGVLVQCASISMQGLQGTIASSKTFNLADPMSVSLSWCSCP